MFLRNFDFATKYYDYKSETEQVMSLDTPINGWYKFINGVLSALMVADNKLYFLYGDDEILITDSHNVFLKKKSNQKNEFVLFDGNKELVRFVYDLPDPKFNVSPFEYIDEEDFKWGDFIGKIVNSKERQRNFVANLMELL